METVNRVVDAGYKALWGQSDTTPSRPFGTESVNKIIDSGKKAIWGEETPQIAHGEEPVSGIQGQGTATDPYDAGNRDEQPNAPPVEAGAEEKASSPVRVPIEKRVTQSHSSIIDSASPTQYTMGTALSNMQKEAKQAPDADPESGLKMRPDPGPDQPSKMSQHLVKKEAEQPAEDAREPKSWEASDNRLDTADYKRGNLKGSGKPNGAATNSNNQDIENIHPAAAAALTATSSYQPSGAMQGPRPENPKGNMNGNAVNRKGHRRNRSKMEKVKDKLHLGKSHRGD
ncbi:hypothetical protein VTN31DRAFT_2829 [Thermomyces dupontii]|uniref:uncharacterized protein n=1 Tax=Talaromyces thermophilus TaxID=28565 RepID=UPI003742C614